MPPDLRSPAQGPLRRLKVLDLTARVAGPFATKLLADYGADVVKVEIDPLGDPCRQWNPLCSTPEHGSHSALYSYLNTNKRTLALNPRHSKARSLLAGLASRSDVVVESFPPGELDTLGLGYEALRAERANIVLTSVTSFGQHGTFRDYEATELNVFALAGKMSTSGTRPRPPVRLLAGSSLYMAGTVAAAASLASVRAAKRTGIGDHVDVAVAKVVLGAPDRGLCLASYVGADVERPDGPRPFQTFPAADGFVVINVNRGLERVAEMIGRPEVAKDPRFANTHLRQVNAADLEPIIMEWTVSNTKAEIVAASRVHRVIAAPVATVGEVLANEHLGARGFFRAVAGAACPCHQRMPGPPFRMHGIDQLGWTQSGGSRPIGADSREILSDLGLAASEIQRLIDDEAVIAPAGGAGEHR